MKQSIRGLDMYEREGGSIASFYVLLNNKQLSSYFFFKARTLSGYGYIEYLESIRGVNSPEPAKKKEEINYTNGDKYVGSFNDDQMYHGFGSYYWADGRSYEGDFENGYMHGLGTFNYANGDRYEGEFSYSNIEGLGIYYFKNGDYFIGEHKQGITIEGAGVINNNGFQYAVEVVNGKIKNRY